MESHDLNSPTNDDRLESLLRETDTALPDDGFSARVLAALPAHAPSAMPTGWAWHRPFCYAAGTVAGVIYAVVRGTTWADTASAVDQMSFAVAKLSVTLSEPMVIAAMSIAALSLLVAFQAELRERLLP